MTVNLVILIVIGVLAVLAGWLTWRARRVTRALLKWPAMLFGGLLTILLALIAVLIGVGFYKVYSPRGNPVVEVKIDLTPDQLARGEHLANFICSSCHSTNDQLPLSGGKDLAEEIPIPLGHLIPPNLTPAGPLKDWTDGEIMRAVREGTNKDRHLMAVMSSQSFRDMSDDDIKSVIAYVRSQPAVQNETANEQLNVLALAFYTIGFIPSKPVPAPRAVPAVARGPTVEYGHYLVNIIGCAECHGADLTGGKGGLLPKGPNLRVVKAWSQADFFKTLRTGTDPGGKQLDRDKMPWNFIGRLEDDELAGLYKYVTSLQ